MFISGACLGAGIILIIISSILNEISLANECKRLSSSLHLHSYAARKYVADRERYGDFSKDRRRDLDRSAFFGLLGVLCLILAVIIAVFGWTYQLGYQRGQLEIPKEVRTDNK